MCHESVGIKAYHLTGHDLIAIKISNQEIFSQLGVRSQKHFFPLASGPIHIRRAIGSQGAVRSQHCGKLEDPPRGFQLWYNPLRRKYRRWNEWMRCSGQSARTTRCCRHSPRDVVLSGWTPECCSRLSCLATTQTGVWKRQESVVPRGIGVFEKKGQERDLLR